MLAAGAAAVAVLALRAILPRLAGKGGLPDFEAIEQPAGFRGLRGSGPLTVAALATIGIGGEETGAGGIDFGDATGRGDAALCAALFGDATGAGPAAGRGAVPVAFFYDFLCPICRDILPELEAMAADPGAGIALSWHVLTGLGPASDTAARAVLAARGLGQEAALRRRLMRAAFQPDRAYVAAVARSIGADPAALLAAMDRPAVGAELARGRALARAFAIPGTPALVVGRTRVIGALRRPALTRLITIEAADRSPWPCG